MTRYLLVLLFLTFSAAAFGDDSCTCQLQILNQSRIGETANGYCDNGGVRTVISWELTQQNSCTGEISQSRYSTTSCGASTRSCSACSIWTAPGDRIPCAGYKQRLNGIDQDGMESTCSQNGVSAALSECESKRMQNPWCQ